MSSLRREAPQGIMGKSIISSCSLLLGQNSWNSGKEEPCQKIPRNWNFLSLKMSSRRMPDRFEPFNVSGWQPNANNPAPYSHSELGYFSIDEERHFLHNKSKLGNLNLPQDCKHLDIDLNVGFEQWRELPNVQQHLDSMLYWILLNKELLTIAGDFQASNDGVRYSTLDVTLFFVIPDFSHMTNPGYLFY